MNMSYCDDHMKRVAKRQAEKLKSGVPEKEIIRYLEWCHWTSEEVALMMKIAKREVNKGVEKNGESESADR